MTSAAKTRCSWVGDDPLYIDYHDTEWGVPIYDHRALFEKLILDGFQAGLAWITILRKRDNFIAAFDGFRPELIAAYGPDKVEALMADAGIVRNRAKIEGTIASAKAWLELMERDGGFSGFLWDFVDDRPTVNRWPAMNQVPSETNESKNMSKTLKSLGFKFCGPTICYAFMQAVGMVNDHTTDCFRHGEV
jgi:DNA-3-methyladenine glycosylase I